MTSFGFFSQDISPSITPWRRSPPTAGSSSPAAVVCATDRIAFGVYKVMSEKGIRIPEEVSVVGFGDYEAGELLQPPLTTVKFDWKNWGEISAESMIQMILGKPVSPLQVNPYEIIERKSVKEN